MEKIQRGRITEFYFSDSFFTTRRFIPGEEWTGKLRRGLLILLHLHILTGDLFPGRMEGILESLLSGYSDIFFSIFLVERKASQTRGKNGVSVFSPDFTPFLNNTAPRSLLDNLARIVSQCLVFVQEALDVSCL